MTKEHPLSRLLKKLKVVKSGCWEWQAGKDKDGYGKTYGFHKHTHAHRLVWEIVNNRSAQGMLVCHKCDNPPCCNPDHLYLGTPKRNTMDIYERGRKQHTLTKEQVEYIHRVYLKAPKVGRRKLIGADKLAKKFGCYPQTITKAARGEYTVYCEDITVLGVVEDV